MSRTAAYLQKSGLMPQYAAKTEGIKNRITSIIKGELRNYIIDN